MLNYISVSERVVKTLSNLFEGVRVVATKQVTNLDVFKVFWRGLIDVLKKQGKFFFLIPGFFTCL